ncbi:MAG: hypothetical protein PHP08_04335 [Candidatus Dojkabacteria bacterium]|nr:hypothetical protein [Candidatus Dojkabacteria bacterium]
MSDQDPVPERWQEFPSALLEPFEELEFKKEYFATDLIAPETITTRELISRCFLYSLGYEEVMEKRSRPDLDEERFTRRFVEFWSKGIKQQDVIRRIAIDDKSPEKIFSERFLSQIRENNQDTIWVDIISSAIIYSLKEDLREEILDLSTQTVSIYEALRRKLT